MASLNHASHRDWFDLVTEDTWCDIVSEYDWYKSESDVVVG